MLRASLAGAKFAPTRRGDTERRDSSLNFRVVPVTFASRTTSEVCRSYSLAFFVYQSSRGSDIALLAMKVSLAPRSTHVIFLLGRAAPPVAALATWGMEGPVAESGCNTG